jgi:plastocyanin
MVWLLTLPLIGLLMPVASHGQSVTVTGSVEITKVRSQQKNTGNGDVVVWLTPLPSAVATGSSPVMPAKKRFTLLQKNKTFTPHVLVVTVGADVDFPNRDPFFHNAFSLYEGKRFDLGLYESGSTRSSRFDRPGISYLFCNIHPEMSAVIIALDTPYYATSDKAGDLSIPSVPAGRYTLHVWREGTSPDTLKGLTRPVLVSTDSTSIGKLVVPNNASFPLTHKNKYGHDYESPTPQGQEYVKP